MDCTYKITDVGEFVNQANEYLGSPEVFIKAIMEQNYFERIKILGQERKFLKSYLEFALSVAKRFESHEAYDQLRNDAIECIKKFDATALIILNK